MNTHRHRCILALAVLAVPISSDAKPPAELADYRASFGPVPSHAIVIEGPVFTIDFLTRLRTLAAEVDKLAGTANVSSLDGTALVVRNKEVRAIPVIPSGKLFDTEVKQTRELVKARRGQLFRSLGPTDTEAWITFGAKDGAKPDPRAVAQRASSDGFRTSVVELSHRPDGPRRLSDFEIVIRLGDAKLASIGIDAILALTAQLRRYPEASADVSSITDRLIALGGELGSHPIQGNRLVQADLLFLLESADPDGLSRLVTPNQSRARIGVRVRWPKTASLAHPGAREKAWEHLERYLAGAIRAHIKAPMKAYAVAAGWSKRF